MSSIAFIGLGAMGAPMTENLLKKGFSVTVYNRTRSKAEELAAFGAKVASTPAEAAAEADTVITMLSNDDVVREIYEGEDGVFSVVRPGMILMDSSTISPSLARELAVKAGKLGASFLDAPVTGSKPGAVNGTLLFMIGGEADVLKRAEPVISAMGTKIIHMGPSGSGAVAKLSHNAIVGISNVALAEGLIIAASGGLDLNKFTQIVNGGVAGSKTSELKTPKLLGADYSVQFGLSLMLKDLRLASVLSDGLKVPTPMLEAAKTLFQAAEADGHGELDLCAVAKVYEQWAGTKLNSGEPVYK
ncbi:NAD(P)-dependent oxidoreductase [Paenibacillus beijingensis]|uniref:3-hydroxyisobutyrate dehydrogenase n=1 Tax=Paenibacillus beijingensis TaxID=1126833 RepID=A0A0D5NF42_9BACL|nr:NAD(P)-dependent oxidoreductase [Paenibacillus beijingensis]AJY73750.1 3-hydroxyisobutyrate dehydrogenase [Paenibacillus beijingensis]